MDGLAMAVPSSGTKKMAAVSYPVESSLQTGKTCLKADSGIRSTRILG